ncbi:MAG: cysteine hydrolase [Alphaproteobacteria bacterium]|nr:cysteine hydrolase [Alphaproteobacteria bacterium]
MTSKQPRAIIEGQPVLVVVDIQQGAFMDGYFGIPSMAGTRERSLHSRQIIDKARACRIPLVFIQEAHRRDHVDFGRELDGVEDVHCLEGDKATEIAVEMGMRPDDYFIRKRRYSVFFGTDFAILLKGLQARTLVLIGGLTDVCVHYTFVDGHQHDYFCRVVEDCVVGSTQAAHDAALAAMEYLQTGARRSSSEIMAAFEAFAARPKAASAA